jgi:hypothetical protein
MAVSGLRTICSLAQGLLARRSDILPDLRFVLDIDETVLVVMGPEEKLPWVDGALYLTREDESALYLPTAIAPNVPPALFERCLAQKFSKLRPPVAVIPQIRSATIHPSAQSSTDSDETRKQHPRNSGNAGVSPAPSPDNATTPASLISLSDAGSLSRDWLTQFLERHQ